MSHTTRGVGTVVAVLVLTVVAACGSSDEPSDGRSDHVSRDSGHKAEKTGTGQLRRDLEPLTKRFDALGSPAKAVWMSGTLGDPEVPGTSSYWIDAIVTLAPGEARSLRNKFRATKTERDPEVVDELRTRLPEGPLLSSDALDSAFSGHGFASDAFLDVTSNQVVVTAKGQ